MKRQKRIKLICMIVALIMIMSMIVSCAGPQGEPGQKGDKGDPGIAGADGENGKDGQDGEDGLDGITPHIGVNGNWWVGTQDTGIRAEGVDGQDGKDGVDGKDGIDGKDGVDGQDGKDGKDGVNGQDGTTPHIGENGNWWIGGEDTGIRAEGVNGQDGKDGQNGKDGATGKDGANGKDGQDGKDGVNGTDGKDGTTPHIGENGNWWIGDEDTGIRAEGTDGQNGQDGKDGVNGTDGKDGTTPHIGENGNWWIGDEDTGIRAEAKDGQDGKDGANGADGKDGQDGKDGEKGDPGENGADGKTPVFRVNNGWLQWKYEGESVWQNLYQLDVLLEEGLASVRFVTGGGSLPGGVASEIVVTEGSSIYLPTPEYAGYAFDGWYIEGEDYPVTSPYRVHENVTLQARWVPGAQITGTKIYTMSDLVKINNDLEGTYILMNDIDCDGLVLPQIGASDQTPFRGIFDGQGFTISNFTISPTQYTGLFGYNAGTIRNLNVADIKLSAINLTMHHYSYIYVGGIAGYNTGLIEQCSVQNCDINVALTNTRYAGLIAGCSYGTIQNCFTTGNIYVSQAAANSQWAIAGGIVGINNGIVDACFASATLFAYSGSGGYSYGGAGGIAGSCAANSMISNCIVLGGSMDANCVMGDIGGVQGGGKYSNCYRSEHFTAVTWSTTNATLMTDTQLERTDFYEISLGWDLTIWDITNINLENGRYPTLNQK